MKSELQTTRVELRAVKRSFLNALQESLRKDHNIRSLENKLFGKGELQFFSTRHTDGDFQRFEKYFSENELRTLRSLSFEQSADSTFARNVLMYLYHGNETVISQKVIIGRENSRDPISPQKYVILKEMFDERLDGIPLDEEVRNIRKKGSMVSYRK